MCWALSQRLPGHAQSSALIFFMVRWEVTCRTPGRPMSLPVRKAS